MQLWVKIFNRLILGHEQTVGFYHLIWLLWVYLEKRLTRTKKKPEPAPEPELGSSEDEMTEEVIMSGEESVGEASKAVEADKAIRGRLGRGGEASGRLGKESAKVNLLLDVFVFFLTW